MLNRIFRLLATSFSAYSFYSNPVRFVIGVISVLIIPYLAYIFWGSLIIVALAITGLYFIYKAIKASINNNRSSYY